MLGNYITVDGVSSRTLGLFCKQLPMFPVAVRGFNATTVGGRLDDIYQSANHFGDIQFDIEAVLIGFDMDPVIRYFTAGKKLVFSNIPDRYAVIRQLVAIDQQRVGNGALELKITLKCSPFKYSTANTQREYFASPGYFKTVGTIYSEPLIAAKGCWPGFAFSLNGSTITTNGLDEIAEITGPGKNMCLNGIADGTTVFGVTAAVREDKTVVLSGTAATHGDVTTGYYVNKNNGNLVEMSSMNCTDFIDVSDLTSIRLKGIQQSAYYNASKVYAGDFHNITSNVSTETEFSIPSGAAYIRCSITNGNLAGAYYRTESGGYKYFLDADACLILFMSKTFPAGTYKISGCPSGGSSSTYYLEVLVGDTSYKDTGEGGQFTLSEETAVTAQIVVKKGKEAPTGRFYPMICTEEAYEADPSYAPYGTVDLYFDVPNRVVYTLVNGEKTVVQEHTSGNIWDLILVPSDTEYNELIFANASKMSITPNERWL